MTSLKKLLTGKPGTINEVAEFVKKRNGKIEVNVARNFFFEADGVTLTYSYADISLSFNGNLLYQEHLYFKRPGKYLTRISETLKSAGALFTVHREDFIL